MFSAHRRLFLCSVFLLSLVLQFSLVHATHSSFTSSHARRSLLRKIQNRISHADQRRDDGDPLGGLLGEYARFSSRLCARRGGSEFQTWRCTWCHSSRCAGWHASCALNVAASTKSTIPECHRILRLTCMSSLRLRSAAAVLHSAADYCGCPFTQRSSVAQWHMVQV
ncbi:hypothetical protein IEO21_07361 [Rhodonia placenta]|uniref:Secreted protein n=1 Tax=Rhodonia placenta TaxID=104341 RepID=A0A8H7NY98_9APHY|nr:hypothetical protein IEO21_07361 [Postia placenta]